MKKILSVLTVISMFCILFASCGGNEQKLEKVTFVLDWTPNTNHTGIYVAQKLGYFAEEGIEVEIAQPPEDSSVVLVASGKADVSISFQDSLAAAFVKDNTLPVTAIAAIIQHNTSGIISRKGEGMDRPSGMAGHSYATWNGAIELATLKEVIEADGGNFDDVSLIPSTVNDEVTALKTKSVDSIWIFYAWAGIKAELEGLPFDYFAFSDIDTTFDYYTPVIIAGDKFLEERPDAAKAFMRAVSKGYEYCTEHPEEAAEILCAEVPELDIELVKASQKYLADKYKADAKQWGHFDSARWNAFYEWINEKKLIEGEVLLNHGFTNDYLPEN